MLNQSWKYIKYEPFILRFHRGAKSFYEFRHCNTVVIIAKEIVHIFTSTNFVKTKRLKIAKNKRKLRTFSGWAVQAQKNIITSVYNSF